tara:strand:- start:356 stop:1681 length:1326 start_codon:yes stop_codon:yes gene_type:complete
MANTFDLNRRTFLRGTGAALALPFMESLSHAKAAAELPRRMAFVYFPFGVALPKDGSPGAEWNWFPKAGKTAKDFQFRSVLKSLEPLRDEVTVMSGLSHPRCRSLGGHDTGDTWLTGHRLAAPTYSNAVSVDQLAAQHLGPSTRFPSLVLSSDGGVGEPTRSTTISFSRTGRPVPALASPKQIFAKLFGQTTDDQQARQRLNNTQSLLDLVLANSKNVRGKLGARDQAKLDEYLDSVRDIEKRVEQSQKWLEIPKPRVEEKTLDLSATPKGPEEYIRVMYDLMYLAFQTDTTRLATYMIGQVAGATTIANSFPTAAGQQANWHGLAHGAGKKPEALGKFDQFLVAQLARFLTRLKDTREGDGTLLDRTMVLYGSSNSRTHNNTNYPLLLAGGRGLGLQHGQFQQYDAKTPFANVFVTMFDRMRLPVDRFADSTGGLDALVS